MSPGGVLLSLYCCRPRPLDGAFLLKYHEFVGALTLSNPAPQCPSYPVIQMPHRKSILGVWVSSRFQSFTSAYNHQNLCWFLFPLVECSSLWLPHPQPISGQGKYPMEDNTL